MRDQEGDKTSGPKIQLLVLITGKGGAPGFSGYSLVEIYTRLGARHLVNACKLGAVLPASTRLAFTPFAEATPSEVCPMISPLNKGEKSRIHRSAVARLGLLIPLLIIISGDASVRLSPVRIIHCCSLCPTKTL